MINAIQPANQKSILAERVDGFSNGRCVALTTADGTYPVYSKDGQIEVHYPSNAAILTDEAGTIIIQPLTLDRAYDLAGRVLSGDTLALTHPTTLLMMATALRAFAIQADAAE